MRNAVTLVKDHRALIAIDQEARGELDRIKERRKFLKKQLEDLDKEREKVVDRVNEQIAHYLRSASLLPENFNPEKHHFHYDAGALIVCDEVSERASGIEMILGQIFGGPPN